MLTTDTPKLDKLSTLYGIATTARLRIAGITTRGRTIRIVSVARQSRCCTRQGDRLCTIGRDIGTCSCRSDLTGLPRGGFNHLCNRLRTRLIVNQGRGVGIDYIAVWRVILASGNRFLIMGLSVNSSRREASDILRSFLRIFEANSGSISRK